MMKGTVRHASASAPISTMKKFAVKLASYSTPTLMFVIGLTAWVVDSLEAFKYDHLKADREK